MDRAISSPNICSSPPNSASTGVSRDPAWRSASGRRTSPARAASALDASPRAPLTLAAATREPVDVSANAAEALAAVRADIGDCTRCKLHTLGRTQIVFGVGNPERRPDVRRRGAGRRRRRSRAFRSSAAPASC